MGTNYYWYPRPECPHCKRPYEPVHIGTSITGWCFALHVIPEEGINTLMDWIKRFDAPNAIIEDEYGNVLSSKEMQVEITERSAKEVFRTACFLEDNFAQEGPNHLLRSRLVSGHCVGHGEGTWDYLVGEFS